MLPPDEATALPRQNSVSTPYPTGSSAFALHPRFQALVVGMISIINNMGFSPFNECVRRGGVHLYIHPKEENLVGQRTCEPVISQLFRRSLGTVLAEVGVVVQNHDETVHFIDQVVPEFCSCIFTY